MTRGAGATALAGLTAFALAALGAPAAAAVTADAPAVPAREDLEAAAHELLGSDPAVQAVVPQGDGAVLYVAGAEPSPETLAFADAHAQYEIRDLGEPFTTRAANEVVGGAGYAFRIDGALAACSIGFAAWTPAGGDAVLSAGHCAEGRTDLTAVLTRPSEDGAAGGSGPVEWGTLGTLGFAQFGQAHDPRGAVGALDSVDIAAIDLDPAAGLDARPAVTQWTTAAQDDLAASATPIARVGEAHDGLTVAKSGRTTGVTTGTVEGGLGWAQVGGTVVHGFLAELAAGVGDSGGAVYAGDAAVGLISGGNATHTWVADLGTALQQTGGYTLKLDLAEPEVTTPADLTAVEAGATIGGTAHPGTTLSVEVHSPAAVHEVAVGADGAWSWVAPAVPGTYDVRLSVRDDGFNSSDAVDVRMTVRAPSEPSPEPSEEPTPEPTPTPEPSEDPTPSPEPSQEPAPEPSPTPEPTPTEQPAPSLPDPEDTPAPAPIPADPAPAPAPVGDPAPAGESAPVTATDADRPPAADAAPGDRPAPAEPLARTGMDATAPLAVAGAMFALALPLLVLGRRRVRRA